MRQNLFSVNDFLYLDVGQGIQLVFSCAASEAGEGMGSFDPVSTSASIASLASDCVLPVLLTFPFCGNPQCGICSLQTLCIALQLNF